MSPAVVELEGVGRSYGRVAALRGIDLRIEGGDAVALLGPNGAGKSTLLRIVASLLSPTAGRVRLFGEDPRQAGPRLRRRLGVVAHASFLYPDLSVAENLEFQARWHGLPDRQARIDAVVGRVRLEGWRHRPVRSLSRGLEQRAALARALLPVPDLLLLDEPFSGLDADAADTLTAILREERRRGATLVLVTHDLDRAEILCDRAVVLSAGRVRFAGVMPMPLAGEYRRLVRSERGE